MLDIYKASAGSGKTFALTLEYFRIVFQMPSEYKNILAVTFTNKATEEMKSRIINELHHLARGDKSDYGNILKQELRLGDEQLQNRASLLRTLLLHDYGRLSVTTIDRFFQRIIKSFTHELGIFPGYNVELDSDFVLLKAVDKVMQQVKENPELRDWISELMNNSVEEGKSWSVKAKIAELGEELFRENYMLFDKQVLSKFEDKHFLKSYHDFLTSTAGKYEQKLTGIAAKALKLIQNEGLVLTDFKGGKMGCASWFYKLSAGNFDEPTATIRKGGDELEAWVTKTSVNKGKIEAIRPQLCCWLKEALQIFDGEYRFYLSAQQMAGNLYQLGILNDLYQEVRAYCDEKGLMLLSDTTHILNLLIADNDTSFLFEKCGNFYKHLMIDEFQDTSAMQWKNFHPLVVNSLGEGCKAIIVGDVKQSIYRWRNGDWSLLAYEVEQQFKQLGVNNILLKDNWRSATEIVHFNNRFFTAAADILAGMYYADTNGQDQRAGIIKEAYQGLEQTPKKNKQGYVDIYFGPEKKEEECDKIIMANVVATIRNIQERGGKQKEVVILVRGAKEGAFVADYLMEYNKTATRSIRFISNDSLYVWSSPYVQFIVAVLKYIAEPYDRINKATILYFYHTFVKSKARELLHGIFCQAEEEDLFSALNTNLRVNSGHILSYSLFETIELIIGQFSLKEKQEEVPYLIAFQDIIYEYETGNSNSINLFLEWWSKEQHKRVLTTSEEIDAVRILTIHKSKGLEFEYVILPFCSWELDSVRPVRRIWCSNNEQGFKALEYAPLNYSSKLGDTIFRENYLDEHLKAYIDNLNLLYVALTRAKTELYLRPYRPKTNKDGSLAVSDIGAFVYRVLTEMTEDLTDYHYTLGGKLQQGQPDKAESVPWVLTNYPVFQPGKRICVKYRYRDYEMPGQSVLSAIDEGKLLHEIFKLIRYVDDVRNAVRHACLAGLISSREQDSYNTKIREYLQAPQASEWFGPESKVVNERDILFPGGDKVRPDRIVICRDCVKIIDYKFGQNEENKYLKQVRFYRTTLERMGYERVEGYVWYVKLGKIVKV